MMIKLIEMLRIDKILVKEIGYVVLFIKLKCIFNDNLANYFA